MNWKEQILIVRRSIKPMIWLNKMVYSSMSAVCRWAANQGRASPVLGLRAVSRARVENRVDY